MLHKETFRLDIAFEHVDIRRTGTIVLGDSEAALRATLELQQNGVEDLILVTPDRSHDAYQPADSHYWHEQTLDDDLDTMDGDIVLALETEREAALSYLVTLGAEVSEREEGLYIERAADGKTVQELLLQKVKDSNIEIYERYQVLRFLVAKKHINGVFLLNRDPKEGQVSYKVLLADNVVVGTGEPTSVYSNTTYMSERSATYGLAVLAGAKVKNAAEWRFGLSVKAFPLKLTRAFMSVLPRIYSVDKDGREHDFLTTAWPLDDVCQKMLLKADHWAFDVRQIESAGAIDLLIKTEEDRGRGVFVDYRENLSHDFSLDKLTGEISRALKAAGAMQETPVERLRKLDENAYQACLANGIDLEKEPLAVHTAAGHHIGGLTIDEWWQTSFEGLYAVGEAAAVYGADHEFGKLSAGQIGAIRAARHIAEKRNKGITKNHIDRPMRDLVREFIRYAKAAVDNKGKLADEFEDELREKLNRFAMLIREKSALQSLNNTLRRAMSAFDTLRIRRIEDQGDLIHMLNTWYAQAALVFASLDLFESETSGGIGAVYYDGSTACLTEQAEEMVVQEIWLADGKFESEWRELRPLPSRLSRCDS